MIFKARGIELNSISAPFIMGILNVTPDSFSDGSLYYNAEKAVSHALEMIEDGANIIDVGGQSTRPGYSEVSPEEEWVRIENTVKDLSQTKALISIDTYFPYVAEKALECGAHIINDVSGTVDEKIVKAVKKYNAGYIIMHNGGIESLAEIKDFFKLSVLKTEKLGIPQENICFDPGVGFGKTKEQNLKILESTKSIKLDNYFYLIAASRKRCLATDGDKPSERDVLTHKMHLKAVKDGAQMVRVHDVKGAKKSFKETRNGNNYNKGT